MEFSIVAPGVHVVFQAEKSLLECSRLPHNVKYEVAGAQGTECGHYFPTAERALPTRLPYTGITCGTAPIQGLPVSLTPPIQDLPVPTQLVPVHGFNQPGPTFIFISRLGVASLSAHVHLSLFTHLPVCVHVSLFIYPSMPFFLLASLRKSLRSRRALANFRWYWMSLCFLLTSPSTPLAAACTLFSCGVGCV